MLSHITHRKFKHLFLSASIFGAMALSSNAQADMPVLNAHGVVSISGTTDALHPELSGVVLQDTLVNWTDGLGSAGQVQTRVVKEDVSGTLDFYYRLLNGSGPNFIEALRTTDYSGVNPISVDYRTDGLGSQGPDSVKRVGINGEQGVNFIFTNSLDPAQDSYFMFVHTNATTYGLANADILTLSRNITGGFTENLSTGFQVYAPVPEPSEWLLMLAGLGLLGVTTARRKQK